ncbi:hypothetical protein RRG08_054836 [Elysia crispata]|uniref:Uncharacterized protein n=1 Tax=Elysia crispata TaxID=231223 RepID=A0AAE1A6Q7_9GAST|nr:hypothetical protein RRG08_054836 [Elysia crispata]
MHTYEAGSETRRLVSQWNCCGRLHQSMVAPSGNARLVEREGNAAENSAFKLVRDRKGNPWSGLGERREKTGRVCARVCREEAPPLKPWGLLSNVDGQNSRKSR